jgi:hypothetical protein
MDEGNGDYGPTGRMSDHERTLLDVVQRQLNAGAREVSVPGHLVAESRSEMLTEIRRLCKLAGARISEVRM